MKKLTWIFILSVLFIAVGVVIFYSTFNLFPSEEIFLDSFTDANQIHYKVMHIPSNATTEDVIQIRRLKANNDYEIVKILRGYTGFSRLKGGSSDTLAFVVWKTKKEEQKDTLQIKLH